jgi:predicted GNAT superfamily acetyltransferase
MDVNTGSLTTSITASITIHPLTDVEACRHLQEIERLIWGNDEVDAMPIHVLITLSKNGGLVLGAYAADGPASTGGMVGVALGWLGTGVDPATPAAPPKLKFCSHMAGVLPAWQGKHIGLRLKLAQREHVLAQGLTEWMTWTYDPLYRANGVFNIHRLGATCTTYMRNIYGEMTDELNRGVPSDRCQVDWRLTSPHVLHKLQEVQPNPRSPQHTWAPDNLAILPSRINAAGFASPITPTLPNDGRPVAVPVPSDIGAIRRADHELSMAWRLYLRAVLEEAFDAGYTLVDCIDLPDRGWHYILVREYM